MVRNDLSCFDQPNRRNDPLHQLLRALLQIEQLPPGPTPRRNKGTDSNKVCGTEEYRQGLAALHKKLNALPNSAKSEAKFLLEVADSKDIRLKLVPLPRLMPAELELLNQWLRDAA